MKICIALFALFLSSVFAANKAIAHTVLNSLLSTPVFIEYIGSVHDYDALSQLAQEVYDTETFIGIPPKKVFDVATMVVLRSVEDQNDAALRAVNARFASLKYPTHDFFNVKIVVAFVDALTKSNFVFKSAWFEELLDALGGAKGVNLTVPSFNEDKDSQSVDTYVTLGLFLHSQQYALFMHRYRVSHRKKKDLRIKEMLKGHSDLGDFARKGKVVREYFCTLEKQYRLNYFISVVSLWNLLPRSQSATKAELALLHRYILEKKHLPFVLLKIVFEYNGLILTEDCLEHIKYRKRELE